MFVNRVSKRDAPNYYEVITHPMYLNLMVKKLKQGEYYSKAEFQVSSSSCCCLFLEDGLTRFCWSRQIWI